VFFQYSSSNERDKMNRKEHKILYKTESTQFSESKKAQIPFFVKMGESR
jgi:hypothetical protein